MMLATGPALAASMVDPSIIGVGARSLAMGKAYIGLADDAAAIFLNPSGLTQIKGFDFTSMRAALIGDVNYTVIGCAIPVPAGYLGAGFVSSGISSIPLTRWTSSGGVDRPEVYSTTDFSSNVFLLSYANRLSSLFRSEKLKNVSFGATLKYFTQYFSQSSGALDGASGTGLDMDIGLKLKARKWLDIGLVVTNVIPSSMGGRFIWKKNGVAEGIPAYFKGGLAVRVLGESAIKKYSTWDLTVLLDAEKNMDQDNYPALFHTGLEWKMNKYLAIRAGLDQQAAADTSGMGTETNMTFGVGFKLAPFSFDYAYHRYGDISDNTTHYFSIGFSPEPKPETHVVEPPVLKLKQIEPAGEEEDIEPFYPTLKPLKQNPK